MGGIEMVSMGGRVLMAAAALVFASHGPPAHTGVKATSVIGDRVKNTKGEDLGTIVEIVLDREDGRIAYVVLSYGGFLGLGDKLFAIPWDALKPVEGQEAYTLDIDREQLQVAPGFDKDRWPDTADPRWGSDLHRSYAPEGTPGTDAGSRSGEGRTESLEVEAESVKLPLKLERGLTCAFRMENGALERLPVARRSSSEAGQMRLEVKDVSRSETVLTLHFDPSAFGQPQAAAPGEGRSREMAVTLKVAPDGRIREVSPAPGSSSGSIPGPLAVQLGFVFGPGLHEQALEVGRVYSLSAAFAAGTFQGAKLRYEGKTKLGTVDVAKFSIVAPATDETSSGRVVRTGDAYYRLKDGLLEKMKKDREGAAP